MSFPCDNHGPGKEPCPNEGQSTCPMCKLVSYCSSQCQKSHWPIHSEDCNRDIASRDWKPDWFVKQRPPTFIGRHGLPYFSGHSNLWGSIPAIDILNLQANEGLECDTNLSLLFAETVDLRDIIVTVNKIPGSYSKNLTVVLNNYDLPVTLRNLICLLIMFNVDDPEEAADLTLHVWYSSLITEKHSSQLENNIVPLINQFRDEISNRDNAKMHKKKWPFGSSSVTAGLFKNEWDTARKVLITPSCVTRRRADELRTGATMAEDSLDWRERAYCKLTPSYRLGHDRYRRDGLLLPFGADRSSFKVPNPTFYCDRSWPGNGDSDPLAGWHPKTVSERPSGPASNDRYGKLYYSLKNEFRNFHQKIRILKVAFQVWGLKTQDLPKWLPHGAFARIEIANLCERQVLGLPGCLFPLGPLLQHPTQNRHATMIMCFDRAVGEVLEDTEFAKISSRTSELRQNYLRVRVTRDMWVHHPHIALVMLAFYFFLDVNIFFERYMKRHDFRGVAAATSMEIKQMHTVVQQWPFKLKRKLHQNGSLKEFDLLFQSNQCGPARYMEWRRTAEKKK